MGKSFFMKEKDMERNNLLLKDKEKRIKQVKSAELLGISDRHFRRLLKAYKEDGAQALVSKKRGMQNRLNHHRQAQNDMSGLWTDLCLGKAC